MLPALDICTLEVKFISILDPDLVERFRDNLKLSDSDPKKYFGGNHEGYTDYPTF
jgi:hypothetical protein